MTVDGQAVRSVIRQARVVDLEPFDPPPPVDAQALVRNEFTLVSPGTELAFYLGTHAGLADPAMPWAKYPHRPGYAAVGRVVQAGPDSAVAAGERIFYTGKHATHDLLETRSNVCVPCPADLDPRHVLLVRLAQIAHSARLALHRPPGRVLVIGAGLVGNLAAQLLQLAGATVAIADPRAERLELARRCGLASGLPGGPGLGDQARAALGGPPDVVVEAAGVQALIPQALSIVRDGGQVILLGSPRRPVELDVYALVHFKMASLTGAHERVMPPRPDGSGAVSRQEVAEQMLAHLAAGRLKTEGLVTHVIAPAALAQTYADLAAGSPAHLGVVVDWRAPGDA